MTIRRHLAGLVLALAAAVALAVALPKCEGSGPHPFASARLAAVVRLPRCFDPGGPMILPGHKPLPLARCRRHK
jgi:hypothetical protein